MLVSWTLFQKSFFGTYSDVLCSEECQTKKLLVCCKMFAFFKAIIMFSEVYPQVMSYIFRNLSQETCKIDSCRNILVIMLQARPPITKTLFRFADAFLSRIDVCLTACAEISVIPCRITENKLQNKYFSQENS